MLYAIGSSIIVAVIGYYLLPYTGRYLPGVFVGDDGRPCAEPIMLSTAFFFDYFVGRNGLTMWMGWWFFLYVIQSLPWHVYGNILMHLQGKAYCDEHYPDLTAWRNSHKTFVHFIYYATFLTFWWKWI